MERQLLKQEAVLKQTLLVVEERKLYLSQNVSLKDSPVNEQYNVQVVVVFHQGNIKKSLRNKTSLLAKENRHSVPVFFFLERESMQDREFFFKRKDRSA